MTGRHGPKCTSLTCHCPVVPVESQHRSSVFLKDNGVHEFLTTNQVQLANKKPFTPPDVSRTKSVDTTSAIRLGDSSSTDYTTTARDFAGRQGATPERVSADPHRKTNISVGAAPVDYTSTAQAAFTGRVPTAAAHHQHHPALAAAAADDVRPPSSHRFADGSHNKSFSEGHQYNLQTHFSQRADAVAPDDIFTTTTRKSFVEQPPLFRAEGSERTYSGNGNGNVLNASRSPDPAAYKSTASEQFANPGRAEVERRRRGSHVAEQTNVLLSHNAPTFTQSVTAEMYKRPSSGDRPERARGAAQEGDSVFKYNSASTEYTSSQHDAFKRRETVAQPQVDATAKQTSLTYRHTDEPTDYATSTRAAYKPAPSSEYEGKQMKRVDSETAGELRKVSVYMPSGESQFTTTSRAIYTQKPVTAQQRADANVARQVNINFGTESGAMLSTAKDTFTAPPMSFEEKPSGPVVFASNIPLNAGGDKFTATSTTRDTFVRPSSGGFSREEVAATTAHIKKSNIHFGDHGGQFDRPRKTCPPECTCVQHLVDGTSRFHLTT